MMTRLSLTAVVALLSSSTFAKPRNVPPKISGTPKSLGHTYDPGFVQGDPTNPDDPGFYSDGGAGGTVNGYHLLTLSDARVITRAGLVHTVYAFTTGNDPTNIRVLGDYNSDPHFYLQGPNGGGQGLIASDPRDNCHGPTFGPGPNGAMVQLPGNSTGGFNVWSIFCNNRFQYNTLIEYNVEDLEALQANSLNIPADRTVLKLFEAGEPQYGTDGVATNGRHLFFLARHDKYFKLARVRIGKRTQKARYQYYYPTAGIWNHTMPSNQDKSPDTNLLIGSPNAQFGSDIFFSEYFNTWLISYSRAPFAESLYSLAYSTSGKIEGPYHDLGAIYGPPKDQGCNPKSDQYVPAANGSLDLVYLTHSHPGFDASGKTMTVGWISCNTFTNFAKLTWQ